MGKAYYTTKVGDEFIATTSSGGCCAGATGGLGCGGIIGLCILLYPFILIYEKFGETGLIIIFLIIALIAVLFIYMYQKENEDKKETKSNKKKKTNKKSKS